MLLLSAQNPQDDSFLCHEFIISQVIPIFIFKSLLYLHGGYCWESFYWLRTKSQTNPGNIKRGNESFLGKGVGSLLLIEYLSLTEGQRGEFQAKEILWTQGGRQCTSRLLRDSLCKAENWALAVRTYSRLEAEKRVRSPVCNKWQKPMETKTGGCTGQLSFTTRTTWHQVYGARP